MDSALNPYVSLDFPDCVPDVWDQDAKDSVGDVSVDILLPTGYFLPMRVRRDITLAELKEVCASNKYFLRFTKQYQYQLPSGRKYTNVK